MSSQSGEEGWCVPLEREAGIDASHVLAGCFITARECSHTRLLHHGLFHRRSRRSCPCRRSFPLHLLSIDRSRRSLPPPSPLLLLHRLGHTPHCPSRGRTLPLPHSSRDRTLLSPLKSASQDMGAISGLGNVPRLASHQSIFSLLRHEHRGKVEQKLVARLCPSWEILQATSHMMLAWKSVLRGVCYAEADGALRERRRTGFSSTQCPEKEDGVRSHLRVLLKAGENLRSQLQHFRDLPKRHTLSLGDRPLSWLRASRGGMVEMERDEERASLVSGGMGAATSGRAANRRPLLIVASIAMVTLLAVCATQMREPAGTVRTPYQHHLRSGVKITGAFLLHDAHVALSAVAMGMAAPARPLSSNSALLCQKRGAAPCHWSLPSRSPAHAHDTRHAM